MPNMYRVRTVFTGVAGTPWYSNLYFDVSQSTPLSSQEAAFAFWGTLQGFIDNSLTYNVEGSVATVRSEDGELTDIAGLPDALQAGLGTGESMSRALQGLIRASTSNFAGGRRIKGRVFVPGLTETSNEEGRPAPALLTAMNNAGDGLISDADSQWVVWSKKNGTMNAVVSASAWTEFAVLRSRRD